jgi:hypothetical protein
MKTNYGNLSNPHTPVWANAEKTLVNMRVTIAGVSGEHDFTASPQDGEAHGRELYQDAIDGIFGAVQDYVLPPVAQIAALARERRGTLITATDWTQNADIPQATKDKWAPYRQALRDVPQQSGFPSNIVWPTPPQ